MKIVVAIVRPEKLNDVLASLYHAEVTGLSITRVQGHGGEMDRVETYRGTTVKMELSEKVRLDIGVSDHFVDPTVRAILACRPDRRGRGREDLRRPGGEGLPDPDGRGGPGRRHARRRRRAARGQRRHILRTSFVLFPDFLGTASDYLRVDGRARFSSAPPALDALRAALLIVAGLSPPSPSGGCHCELASGLATALLGFAGYVFLIRRRTKPSNSTGTSGADRRAGDSTDHLLFAESSIVRRGHGGRV